MRAHVTTPRGERDIETPLLGRGNLAQRAGGHRGRARVRRAARRDRRARRAPRAGRSPRRGRCGCRGGITLVDDSLQLEPGGAASARSTCSRTSSRRAARSRCSARCSSSATHVDCAARGVRPGGRRTPASTLLIAVGGAPARALADAAIAAGMPRGRGASLRDERRGRRRGRRGRCAPATSCSSRDRAASRTDLVADRLEAERG